MPECLREDRYYTQNTEFRRMEGELMGEILRMSAQMEPWMGKVARLYADGASAEGIRKTLKRSQKLIRATLENIAVVQLINAYRHLDQVQDGPNELDRKMMLWQLAVDNQHRKDGAGDAIRAIAELNKMSADKGGTGGGTTLQIVINNEVLKAGVLDQ